MVGAVVDDDDLAEGGHGFAADAGGVEVAAGDNGLEEVLIAAALAWTIGQVGDSADDEDLGAEVVKGRGNLVSGEGRVQGHEDGAELEEGVGESGKGSAVAEGDGNAVALFDTELLEGGGEPVGEDVEVEVGQACLRSLEG